LQVDRRVRTPAIAHGIRSASPVRPPTTARSHGTGLAPGSAGALGCLLQGRIRCGRAHPSTAHSARRRMQSGRPATRPHSPRWAAWRSMPATRDGCGSSRDRRRRSRGRCPRDAAHAACSLALAAAADGAAAEARRWIALSSWKPMRPCCPPHGRYDRLPAVGAHRARCWRRRALLARPWLRRTGLGSRTRSRVDRRGRRSRARTLRRRRAAVGPRRSTGSRAAVGGWRPPLGLEETTPTALLAQGGRANAPSICPERTRCEGSTRAAGLPRGTASRCATPVVRDLGVRRRIVPGDSAPRRAWAGLTDRASSAGRATRRRRFVQSWWSSERLSVSLRTAVSMASSDTSSRSSGFTSRVELELTRLAVSSTRQGRAGHRGLQIA
jgi:hypothetical protein